MTIQIQSSLRRALWLAVSACITLAAPWASAQVLQRRFDPDRHGPWRVIPMGDAAKGGSAEACDPKLLSVGPGGEVYVLGKLPFAGPPSGGVVLRVTHDGLEQVGEQTDSDPGAFLPRSDGSFLLGGRGTTTDRGGELLGLDDGEWKLLTGSSLPDEITSLLQVDGELLIGAKNDGVYRWTTDQAERVGATTTVVPSGFVWEALGDYTAEQERIAARPDGTLVTLGKDYLVREWREDAWTTLGDLAKVATSELGVVTGLREYKSVLVTPDDTLYVGTKGLTGAPEGKDVGAVFRWTSEDWVRVGTNAALKKEAKQLLWSETFGLVVGTNEGGVFRLVSDEWVALNEGLVANADGKIKGERLASAPDGSLYVAATNALYRRSADASAFAQVGFFPLGQEIKSIGFVGASVYVGTKVGADQGAVYRLDGPSEWTQIGADLPKPVEQLVPAAADEMYAALGGGAGAVIWDGTDWTPMTGALTGVAAEFKNILRLSPTEFAAATKSGVVVGDFRKEPLEVVELALRNREVKSLVHAGGATLAVTKSGVFSLVEQEGSDDGFGWIEASKGLPDVELEGAVARDDEVFVIGKKLLYSGAVAGGVLEAATFGDNPGTAALDGDGNLIFSGETDFKGIAFLADGTPLAATKDGLFVRDSDGAWSLYNGPAEVKAVATVGATVYAIVKEKWVPDLDDPTTVREETSLWISGTGTAVEEPGAGGQSNGSGGELSSTGATPAKGGSKNGSSPGSSDDPSADDEATALDATGCQCRTSGRSGGGLGGWLLLAGVVAAGARRSSRLRGWWTSLKGSLLKYSRVTHRWSGVVLAFLVLGEALTGFFLLHKDGLWGIGSARVPHALLPGWYAKEAEEGRVEPRALLADPSKPEHLVLATKLALFESSDGGAHWRAAYETAAFGDINSLAFYRGSLWVAHKLGLARCQAAAGCQAIDLTRSGTWSKPEVRAVLVSADEKLYAVAHKGPVLTSRDGDTFADETGNLADFPGMLDKEQRTTVHAATLVGSTLYLAGERGVVRLGDGLRYGSAGLNDREVRQLAGERAGNVWALVKGMTGMKGAQLYASKLERLDWGSVGIPDMNGARLSGGGAGAYLASGASVWRLESGRPPVALRQVEQPVEDEHADAPLVASIGEKLLTVGRDGRVSDGVVAASFIGAAAPRAPGVELKKVMDDLHTGKFFAGKLILLYDLLALSLVLFVVTGFHLWIAPQLIKWRRSREAKKARSATAPTNQPRKERTLEAT